jgi:hypothetical protein
MNELNNSTLKKLDEKQINLKKQKDKFKGDLYS